MQLGHASFQNIEGLVFYKLGQVLKMVLVQTKLWYLCIIMYLGIRNRCNNFFEKIHFLTTINLEALSHSLFFAHSRSPRKMGRKATLFLMPPWL
jgi:hypothetical protein